MTPEERTLLNSVILEEILPQNSETVLIQEETSRFSSAEWYEKIQQQKITLAGLGGIGSYVAFLLARLKIAELRLYDPDVVEAINMSGQLYGKQHINMTKANATHTICCDYSDMSTTVVDARPNPFTEESLCSDIMVCGFDNMEARKTFYYKWKQKVKAYNTDEEKAKCLLIDGRLAAEELQVFCIQGNDLKAQQVYQDNWLFASNEAEETICSYKQTSFCANMIASWMVNSFVNFIANQCNPLIPRSVPFMINYDAKYMLLKQIQPWQL